MGIEDSPPSSFSELSISPDGSRSPSRKSSFTLNRKSSFSLRSSRSTSVSSQSGRRRKEQTEKEDQMSRWLSNGNVIYKSVGMGLMDLVVGGEVIKLAREKNIGTTVPNF